jgi:ubiquinone/menaquinone biosynthesis C-methylase UbiE
VSGLITAHYSRGGLLERLRDALREDGIDPDHPTVEALAPYDHFHGRGIEATRELADQLTVAATDHLLDIGSGIGGPARYMADRFGARVTGIDLTAAFCDAARHLTRTLGLTDRVAFEHGDALAMPGGNQALFAVVRLREGFTLS